MKETIVIEMKNGKRKVYRNYGSAVKFLIDNYKNILTTNDKLTNEIFSFKENKNNGKTI